MPTKVEKMDSNIKVVGVPIVQQGQVPINFMDGLALLFIGLKLTGHLEDWTWIAVLSPLWGPFMVSWFVKLVSRTIDDYLNREEK